MLLGLIHGADRIIYIWRARLFNVAAQDVRDHFAVGERNQPLGAAGECVTTSGIDSGWLRRSHLPTTPLTARAASLFPEPVSSSRALSDPKNRYRNGFSKCVHPDSRRM